MAAIVTIVVMPAPLKYSRRNPEPRRRRPSTVTVPEGVSPHVKLLFAEMRQLNVTYDEVEEGSRVRRAALKAWRHKNRPNLGSIEAALGFVGWDFVPAEGTNLVVC
ncbi:hypothetical protein [Methylobacterium radiodurans]|uniref:hypothetical protein n=1 Tax=Methylobacterium radiodurans TaxID=2202828 RepID=UPI00194E85E1|nr:hypothetical protein [Methylobacterium radiodurans]